MEIGEIETVANALLNKAFDEGGKLWFADTLLTSKDKAYMNKLNLILSQYGKIHGIDPDSQWDCFELNNYGVEVVRTGGITKEQERKNTEARLKELDLKVTGLQVEKLEYEKKIRAQEGVIRLHKIFEFISWIITLFIAALHFFFE